MDFDSPPISKTRVVDVFLRYLKAEGVRVVFGVPGGLLHTFFASVEHDPDLQLVVTKHEQGAAYMADGFARVGHGLAVCAGTSGPGATNLLTGVACAYADGIPMLVVTGQAALNSQGRGASQEAPREDMDIVEMFRPVTKYSTMVTSADKMAHHLRRALRQALSGRQGPAHLNVPIDLWNQLVDEDWFDPKSYRPNTQLFDRQAVQQAAELLLKAQHPVILAGAGVLRSGAQEHLQTLAELIQAPVATSAPGKSAFDETHPLSLGVLGFAGHAQADAMLFGKEVDVLLSVGASLDETTTLQWRSALTEKRALLQVDIDPHRLGRNYPVDVALVGDAQTILVELIYHLHRMIRDGCTMCSAWPQAPGTPTKTPVTEKPQVTQSLSPVVWRQEFNALIPDQAIVFSDIGGHMAFNIHHLRFNKQQDFVLNFGFGSMGHGTSAAIGAALAQPHRPVFAIVGDACFTMIGMELLTANEYDIPVIWLVENNNMHGIIWHGGKMLGEQQVMHSVRYKRPVEIAAIARAMGVNAWIVDGAGQLEAVLDEAISLQRPGLIELRVDGDVVPPIAARAQSIAGFAND